MPQLIQYDYDGSIILVEVVEETTEDEEWERVGMLDRLTIVKAKVSFDKVFSTIKPVAQAIMTQINSLETKPQKVEVGFGLAIKASGGAVIASAGVETNLNIKLTWEMGGPQ